MLRGLIKFDDILMYQSTDVYHETTVKSRVKILNCMNMHYNVCSVYVFVNYGRIMYAYTYRDLQSGKRWWSKKRSTNPFN